MKKWIIPVTLAAFVLTGIAAGPAPAADLKIGYIVTPKLLAETKLGKEASAKLKAKAESAEKGFSKDVDELKKMQEDIIKRGSVLNDEEKAKLGEEFERKSREVKRKKDFKEGALAYRRINEMAMQVLERDGILVTCSCSYHMPRGALLDAVQAGARHLDRQLQVLEQLQQSPDHPVHGAIPETDYLKGFIARVLPV